jgi:hypothetical protein
MTIPTSDATECDPAEFDQPGSAAPSGDAPAHAVEPSPAAVGRAPVTAAAAAAPRRRHARRLALHFCVVLLAASALAVAVGGQRAGLSAALGVALAGVNLLLMQRITSAMTVGDGEGAGAGNAAWGLALPFKLVALVGVAYALVRGGVAQPVPLAMGFAILPLTGVFLPRPTSVPDLGPGPRTRLASSHPRRRGAATP